MEYRGLTLSSPCASLAMFSFINKQFSLQPAHPCFKIDHVGSSGKFSYMFPVYMVIAIENRKIIWKVVFMPPPLGAGGVMFSGCPYVGRSVRRSVCPSEAWNTLFWHVHGSVGPPDQSWPFYGMSVRLSVRPSRFPGICWRTHGGNGLKFYVLRYLDHLQNGLVYGHGLLMLLILALFWLTETGQIWGFRAFPRERMEGMAWNFACWCILTTFRNDYFMVTVCWFF